ncbi:MAG: hypothetical protein NWQ28_12010 [Nodularia sp. (in: cyanobacteria)]|nr:hypothetical protein [Nodularia sp. (in: cyanobacteria)]
MKLSVKIVPNKKVTKLTYDVLIEHQPDDKVKATLLGLPNYQSLGATKEEALNNLIELVQQRKPEIVTLEIERHSSENP